ncbi:hypothetical protein Acr_00g0069610 [Actinidia rufa]|uniref:Uncharacterized protein n=1 Tax=Actinidia rufa TaxID=165716 RepID=A0A7J0DR24_9ERIC|nr:hypothetical protein Acr_00g0069610 [Actinidia rufa]
MKDYAIEGNFPYGDAGLFQNLDIVLTAEGYKFVLTQPCPDLSGASAPPEELAAYERWTKANEMTRQDVMRNLLNTKMAEGTLVRLNYLMNKNHYTLSELMNELQAAKGIIKSKKHVLMDSARSSSKLKPKGEKVMKKNKAKHVNKGEAKPRGVQIRDVPKGKCFHCGQDGH